MPIDRTPYTSHSCSFAAVPESVFQLTNLQKIVLNGTGISSRFNFVIEPVIHLTIAIFQASLIPLEDAQV